MFGTRVVKTTKTDHPAAVDIEASTADATPARAAAAPASARDERINARAEEHRVKARKRELKLAPEARTPNDVLWNKCRAMAAQEIRLEGRREWRREKVREVRADLRSVRTRNSAQLAPWLLAAPYAGTGLALNIAAHHAADPAQATNPLGMAVLAGAGAAIASCVAWRKKLGAKVPARYQERVRNWMAIGTAWTAAMPLVEGTSGQSGMWLLALGGTAWAALPWWREHRHPYPTGDALVFDAAVLETDNPAAQSGLAAQIEADYETFVAGRGTLPNSVLHFHHAIDTGLVFDLDLVRGKQKISDVRYAKATICSALDLPQAQLGIAKGRNEYTVEITVITEEIKNPYTGPVIIREGGDVFIEIGPYEDGIGAERFHVLSDQLTPAQLAAGERPRGSAHGGFLLGSKGAGKSRLLEEISAGLRELGVEIWYEDPQEGQSSPALISEADWPLSGLHGVDRDTGEVRQHGNLTDLWLAIKVASELRSAEGAVNGDPGFQHTRERPMIMVEIDECHEAFNATNPITGNSFGEDFADLDRRIRKNGIAILGGSQAITQDTFGKGNKAAVLRDGMCSVNVFVMAYSGKNVSLVPGYDGQPVDDLPLNRGYGYNPKGRRPQARFQARYTPDFGSFLAQRPKATLDERLQKRIGAIYTRRFEKAAVDRAAKQALLDAIDAAEGDASYLPRFDAASQGTQQASTMAPGASSGGAEVINLSPAMRRQQQTMQAAQSEQEVEEELPEDEFVEEEPAEQEGPTAAEQRALDALDDGPKNHTELGKALGISRQGASKHLASLVAKGLATSVDNGRYAAE
jgi:biotin operon repressor